MTEDEPKAKWGEHMTPLKEFVKHHVRTPYEQRAEYLINLSARERVRILVEATYDPIHWDLGRHDWFEQQYLLNPAAYGPDEFLDDCDRKELAEELMQTLFMHFSIRDLEFVKASIEAKIAAHDAYVASQPERKPYA